METESMSNMGAREHGPSAPQGTIPPHTKCHKQNTTDHIRKCDMDTQQNIRRTKAIFDDHHFQNLRDRSRISPPALKNILGHHVEDQTFFLSNLHFILSN